MERDREVKRVGKHGMHNLNIDQNHIIYIVYIDYQCDSCHISSRLNVLN